MSARDREESTADIVDMVGFLNRPTRKRIATTSEHRENASLLSIRQKLAYKATLGIDDLEILSEQLSDKQFKELDTAVRQLLDVEFGHLRVHRHRSVFAIGHHCLDSLIGGLLRVQYHARKIDLLEKHPELDGLISEGRGTLVSWGVGGSLAEADCERLRQGRLSHS